MIARHSTSDLPCGHWAQGLEKMRLVNGLFQDSRGSYLSERRNCISGRDDDADALIMQPIDQAVGPLASSKMDIDERCIGGMLGDQPLGLDRSRGGSSDGRSQSLKKSLHGH